MIKLRMLYCRTSIVFKIYYKLFYVMLMHWHCLKIYCSNKRDIFNGLLEILEKQFGRKTKNLNIAKKLAEFRDKVRWI